MRIVYLNNRFVPLDKAKVSVLDRGLLYGDGVFETMRSYKGVVFRFDRHVERLFKSLKKFDISPKVKPSKIEKIVYRLLEKNGLSDHGGGDAYIKIIVTRGKSSGLLIPAGRRRPTFIVYALPYRPLSSRVHEKGFKVFVSKRRLNEKSSIAGNKTINYLHNLLCRYEAKKKGLDDVILVNTEGFVSEASSSNIFLVRRKKLFTPCLECGCLAGITRKEIIHLAKGFLKCKVNESYVKPHSLYTADEIFLTNSLVEIIPVVKVDNHIVGSGEPGPVTKRLIELYKDSVRKYIEVRLPHGSRTSIETRR